MKIIDVKAQERFDNLEFSNEILDVRARSLSSTYTCPFCRTQIGFQKHHFERLLRQSRTNLPPDFAKFFDEFAHEHLADARCYLDWICPQCELRARVYVTFWAGGRHGDSGIHLVHVLEALPTSSSS